MKRTDGSDRRRMGPSVEPLEARELLSAVKVLPPSRRDALAGRWIDTLQSSGSSGDAAMTPPGRVIQSFFAAFAGSYAVGPGRIQGQALRTYLNVAGTSNTFLHGQAQVAIAAPSDPTQGLSGTATLFDKNYAQTGNFLMLDIQGDPQPRPDGRPTRLTWVVSQSSSGTFSGAEGQGTLLISYHPGGRRPPHALDSGKVGVQFRGQITLNGTTNPLRVR
jgi:hypothetical protein